ncbi:MAG: solute:Na+ symporter, family [Halanaerobiales bacterium]|nr:solute:Na+ symporter, family [Halanaerobiales bacterium]
MKTLGSLDILMMVLYFVVLLYIGYSIMREKRGEGEAESFLAADRNMNLLQTTGSAAATDLGGGFSIAMGGLGFTLGISGSWLIAVSGLSAVFASFLLVPKVKKWADDVKGFTTGDIFGQRFDKKTGLVAAILIGISWFAFVGGQIIAGGKLISGTMGFDLTTAVFIAGAIVLAYTIMGGLKAVIYTDVFQFIILFIGIILLMVPIGLARVGGWSAMMEQLRASAETAKLTNWGAAGWKTIIGWFLSIFPVWFISIATFQRIIAAKDEDTAKKGIFLTGIPIEWPIFAIGTTLVGMFARIMMPELADPEMATPNMIVTLLPLGISGIVVAAYIAAVMSTADSCLIGPVAIFVNDVYKKLFKPDASERQLVKVGRWATLIMGVLAIYLAYKVPSVLDIVLFAYTFGAAGLFFPMLGLLFWKRATATGAFWSIILGGASAILWGPILKNPYGFSESYLGWIVSFLALVIISLMTEHSEEEDIKTFFPETAE